MQTIGKILIGLILGLVISVSAIGGYVMHTTFISGIVQSEVKRQMSEFRPCRCRTGSTGVVGDNELPQ